MRVLSLGGCCLLFALGQAEAAEYYVAAESPQAADTNPGTRAAPLKTVGQACAVARPGDTVFLGRGTYQETLRPRQSGASDRPIRFVALPGEQVTLSGA